MFQSGQKTVGTTAEQVTTESNIGVYTYVLKAHPSNANNIALGNSGVTMDNGLVLDSVDAPIVLKCRLEDLWVIADAASQILCWLRVGLG